MQPNNKDDMYRRRATKTTLFKGQDVGLSFKPHIDCNKAINVEAQKHKSTIKITAAGVENVRKFNIMPINKELFQIFL